MQIELTDEIISKVLKSAAAAQKCGEKTEEFKFFKSLESIWNMTLKSGYLDRGEEPERCLRLIRCKRLLPKEVMNALKSMVDEKTGRFEYAYCSGLWILAPAVYIPKDLVPKCVSSTHKKVDVYTVHIPELDSLGANMVESTFHLNSDGSAMVLESSPLTDYLWLGSHYQPLEI